MKEIGALWIKFTQKTKSIEIRKIGLFVFIHYNMRLKERQLRRCASHYDQINLDNIFLSNVKEEWVSTMNVEDMLERDEEDDFTWLDVSVIDAPNALNFLDDNPICCLLKWILIILYYFVLQ